MLRPLRSRPGTQDEAVLVGVAGAWAAEARAGVGVGELSRAALVEPARAAQAQVACAQAC